MTEDEIRRNAFAPLAGLPVLEVLSAVHILSDLTLPYGIVAYDYLAPSKQRNPHATQ